MTSADQNLLKGEKIINEFRGIRSELSGLRTYTVTAKLGSTRIEKLLEKLEKAGIYYSDRPVFVNNRDGYLIEFPRMIIEWD